MTGHIFGHLVAANSVLLIWETLASQSRDLRESILRDNLRVPASHVAFKVAVAGISARVPVLKGDDLELPMPTDTFTESG